MIIQCAKRTGGSNPNPSHPAGKSDRESELDSLLSHLSDVVVSYDTELRYTFVNRAGASLLGREVENVIGRTNREIIGPAADTIEPFLRRVFEERTRVSAVHEIPLPGRTRRFETVYSPVMNEAGEVERVVGVCRDITDRSDRLLPSKEPFREQPGRGEAGLQTSRRTEAVVTLAGGMAHRFNNALSAVMGNLDLLGMDLAHLAADTRQNLARYIEGMKESLEHMGFLTRQLLAYAQGGRYSPTVIPTDTFVRYTLSLLAHHIDPSVSIDADLPGDLWSVEADTAQVQMLLSAVVQNASEAIEGKGTIRISARNVRIGDHDTDRPGRLEPGAYVLLTVKDDGSGMDEETLERIFDPFFSTKLQGRGLSMAAAYGIVRNHGGEITARSVPGEGTCISIWFPAQEVERKKAVPQETTARTEGTTVLVVEDEEAVLEVFRAALERMGYRVLTASTGREAVETADTLPDRIDLAILDILLPDMDGKSVYPELIRARPDLEVIVTSGYSVEGPAQEILDAGARAFLPKPFSLQALRETITRVLGDAPSLSGRP